MDNGEQKTEKMFLCFLFSHRLFQALVDRSILGVFVHGNCESACSGNPRSQPQLLRARLKPMSDDKKYYSKSCLFSATLELLCGWC